MEDRLAANSSGKRDCYDRSKEGAYNDRDGQRDPSTVPQVARQEVYKEARNPAEERAYRCPA